METFAELLARDRRSDGLALRDPGGSGVEYSYHDLLTTAWKTGNYLRRCGVHEGSTVAVADEPGGPAILAFLGAALNGAVTRFDPPSEVDARVLVAPGEMVAEYDLPPGSTRLAYGDVPEDPGIDNMGRAVWSENPTFPDPAADADLPALVTDDRVFTVGTIFQGARDATRRLGLGTGEELAIRAPLARPGTVTAGLVAPLLVGATIVIPDEDTVADAAVGSGIVPEPTGISPAE